MYSTKILLQNSRIINFHPAVFQSSLWHGPILPYFSVKNLEKYLQSDAQVPFGLYGHFKMFTGSLFKTKLHLLSTALLSGFQSSRVLWNLLSKAVPSKFGWCGGHSKCNCLHDHVNLCRSQAWQIVIIFNTAIAHGFKVTYVQDSLNFEFTKKSSDVSILSIMEKKKSILFLIEVQFCACYGNYLAMTRTNWWLNWIIRRESGPRVRMIFIRFEFMSSLILCELGSWPLMRSLCNEWTTVKPPI